MLPRLLTVLAAPCKGLSTLDDTQCALNWIESSLSAFALNAHSSNPNPIWIDLDRATARENQKGCGMYARVDYQQ